MFNGSIHPFGTFPDKIPGDYFFASANNRKELLKAIKKQLKDEIGNDDVGQVAGNCEAHIQVNRNGFLSEIQEYSANLEKTNLQKIYMDQEQSCYSHLISIQNGIGVYLPIFFFFPLRVSIKEYTWPIFVGSSIKLYTELQRINKKLEAESKIDIKFEHFQEISEEDVEDYESMHEGVENFWSCFSMIVLQTLAKKSLQSKLPLFVF